MIVLETNVLPPITLQDGEAPSGPYLRWIRPTIRDLPFIGTVAPYGEATAGLGTFVALAVVVLLVLGVISLLRRR